ncbi:unnamed protein product [Lactuca saligna]|uniref:DYW domain-containing protein n=1 Tax=Lactuca saligna TaxID=75948 RepID=A0AA36EMA3_LACSI|nr:unnamed protein product [Lactuca saligna]
MTEVVETRQKQLALSLLKTPHSIKCAKHLRSIHVVLLRTGLHHSSFAVGNFVSCCANLGLMYYATQLFDQMPEPNSFVWNTLIRGFQQNHEPKKAMDLFDRMRIEPDGPDRFTYPFVVRSCTELMEHLRGYIKAGDIQNAKVLFNLAPVKDILMYNTLLGGYARHGEVNIMLDFFHSMPTKDLVSWNSVISGLVRDKRNNEAITHFHQMQSENIHPNEITLVTLLSACAQVGALDTGRWLHSYIDRNNSSSNLVVSTSLVDMYSKCGDLDSARQVFDKMSNRDVVAWNAMIMGFSMNGQSKTTLQLFTRMKREQVKPNEITILGVLCACVHSGLVKEGQKLFDSMDQEHGLEPRVEHYGCMVDLLGRSGLLNEAYSLIQSMRVEPHVGVWGALLGACKLHKNVELAETAMSHLNELEHEDGGYLTIMSNIYANVGRWDDVCRVRELMKEKGIGKLRGCSSIEVNGVIYEFGAGEKVHERVEEIYEMIDEISGGLGVVGHVGRRSEVFFDVEDEEKDEVLMYHSEKMAVAFGLISMEKGSVIRVVKNLRICGDCHDVMKVISKMYEREIVVRDRSRFHHFKNGGCSCGDYW